MKEQNVSGITSLDDMDIEESLDFDYSVGQVMINTMEDFHKELEAPYLDPDRHIFYRGERINRLDRPLLPTLFRDRSRLIKDGDYYAKIDADYLLEAYKSLGCYYYLFNQVFGKAGNYKLYDICAFSQHYMNFSPLIDLTKSIYVALSFGLKEKKEYTDDMILYAVEVHDMDTNYTDDRVVAECWLNDYQTYVYDFSRAESTPEMNEIKARTKYTSPNARIINIATNDMMKYQQGLFLLLSDFNLVGSMYLTKNVRSSVNIRKYVISRDICANLTSMIAEQKPWYRFSNLTNISGGIASAISKEEIEL